MGAAIIARARTPAKNIFEARPIRFSDHKSENFRLRTFGAASNLDQPEVTLILIVSLVA